MHIQFVVTRFVIGNQKYIMSFFHYFGPCVSLICNRFSQLMFFFRCGQSHYFFSIVFFVDAYMNKRTLFVQCSKQKLSILEIKLNAVYHKAPHLEQYNNNKIDKKKR